MTRITRSRTTNALNRAIALMVALVLSMAMLTACSTTTAEDDSQNGNRGNIGATTAFPVTITDDASRTVTIKAEPERIVSLAPANTEILFALGLGDKVVGVTTYDDYPAEVADIEKVGDFMSPNLEAIAAENPDLVLATTGVQEDTIKQLEKLGAIVIAIDPQNLEGVYSAIERVGKVTGTSEKAAEVVEGMKDDVAEIQAAVKSSPKVTTFIEIAQNPLYTAGKDTFMDELITLAGGTNVVAESGWVAYSSEQLVAANPDVYFATKGSMSDPASIAQRPGYADLSAVKNGRVIILDDNLVSRPGPRVVQGLKQIAEGLHPEAFKK
ncbi:MAG: ABC transporter substrate-binding protein [Coriobacteriia bacterium]